MPVTLTVMKGVHQGRQIAVGVPEFCIGRDPMCHLRPASKEVHWEHCAIVTREDGVFLRDDAGRGGTYVNDRMVLGGEVQLADRDLISVGPLAFRVNLMPQVVLDLDDEDEEGAPKVAGPDTGVHKHSGDTNVREGSVKRASDFSIKPMRDAQEMLCPH
jgi:predicted component of type VI protein secretion system